MYCILQTMCTHIALSIYVLEVCPLCREPCFAGAYDSKREASAANSQARHAYVDLMSALYHCLGCSFRQQTRNKTQTENPLESLQWSAKKRTQLNITWCWWVTNLTHSFFYNMFIRILYMLRATLCSSSGGQLY